MDLDDRIYTFPTKLELVSYFNQNEWSMIWTFWQGRNFQIQIYELLRLKWIKDEVLSFHPAATAYQQIDLPLICNGLEFINLKYKSRKNFIFHAIFQVTLVDQWSVF